jgi:hypothetical protein
VRALLALVLASVLSAATGASAQDEAAPTEAVADLASERPCPRFRRRLAPFVALLAGPVVHGAGALTGCHRATGRRLGIAQGVGFGGILLGGGGLVLTGASRRTVAPFAAVAILGTGAFLLSWVADVYAAISDGRSEGRPGPTAPWTLSLGYRHVHDPQFDHGPFARGAVEGWLGRNHLFGEAWVALSRDTQRVRGGYERRLWGAVGRGSALDVRLGATWQRFGSDGFQTLAGDLSLVSRVDLGEVGPALVGSFVEAELGVGLQSLGYQAAPRGLTQDVNALLLARIGWGVYVGRWAEVVFAYDHRRDGLEGGLSLDSVAAGNIGFLELEGRGFFGAARRWGLELSVAVGSAWIAGASVLYRAAPFGGAR